MTPTNPTDAQMKLARECAAKVHPYSHNSALILDGERDGTDIVQSALLAIQATEARMAAAVEAERERCARIATRALEKLDEPTQALIVSDAIRSQSNG